MARSAWIAFPRSFWKEQFRQSAWEQLASSLKFGPTGSDLPPDESVLEYLQVLVENGKSEEQVADLMDAFVSRSKEFSSWLFKYLKKQEVLFKNESGGKKVKHPIRHTKQASLHPKSNDKDSPVENNPHETLVKTKRIVSAPRIESASHDLNKPGQKLVDLTDEKMTQASEAEQVSEREEPKGMFEDEEENENEIEEETDQEPTIILPKQTNEKKEKICIALHPQQTLRGNDYDCCWEFLSVYGCRKGDLCNWKHEIPQDRVNVKFVPKALRRSDVPTWVHKRKIWTPYGPRAQNMSWHKGD